jgi:hypothetical protein
VVKVSDYSMDRQDGLAVLQSGGWRWGIRQIFFGEFLASREHCERAFELFGPGPYRNFWEAENARWSATWRVLISILLGYPDAARKRSDDLLAAHADPLIYRGLEELQTDLDQWLKDYNEARSHQGRWCYGKTPMQTFVDSISLAKEKILSPAVAAGAEL